MTEHNARRMTADAQGQVEIIEVFEFQNNGEWHREDRLIALATFYWEAEQDWSDFVQDDDDEQIYNSGRGCSLSTNNC